jgi:ketose-bisphosphate aldolase
MLVSMKDLLYEAEKANKAVAAINVSNMESIMAVLEVAEKLDEPVILQVAPIQIEIQKTTYQETVAMVEVFMKRFDVKAALHLDHATTVEDCVKAIDAGFTSVMYDGSLGDYETNVENSKKVVEYAKVKGITVEAELGKVGGTEGENPSEDKSIHEDLMTDPDQVVDFVTRTGVDCLAVAIGNAHGLYKYEPKLDHKRLQMIQEKGNIPLVLHGGTGIGKDEIKKAIPLGIRKINFFTEVDRAFVKGFVDTFNENKSVYMMAAAEAGRQAMMEIIEDKMKLCGLK